MTELFLSSFTVVVLNHGEIMLKFLAKMKFPGLAVIQLRLLEVSVMNSEATLMSRQLTNTYSQL